MQPTNPSSAVAWLLKTHGEGIYLVGFDVKDIPRTVKRLREKGVMVTERTPEWRPNESVAWMHPKDAHGVFIE